jgi:hypothetical protein
MKIVYLKIMKLYNWLDLEISKNFEIAGSAITKNGIVNCWGFQSETCKETCQKMCETIPRTNIKWTISFNCTSSLKKLVQGVP